jgi:hypothetical protein
MIRQRVSALRDACETALSGLRPVIQSAKRKTGANRLKNLGNSISRRRFAHLAGAIAGVSIAAASNTTAAPPATVPLFDGKTLNGWVLLENTVYRVSRYDISDPAIFIGKITRSADPVSTFLHSTITKSLQNDLSTYATGTPQANVTLPAVVNELNQLLTGPSIYNPARFQNVALRPATKRLLAQKPQGLLLAHFNKLLLEDAYPTDLVRNPAPGWLVKDGALASTGTGRGVIYTAKDYTRYRLTLTMRHVSGNPDHQACFLIFCARPQPGEIPLDVLSGIQFQPPNSGHWDYRPAVNGSGGAEFTTINKPNFDPHQWSRTELLVDAGKGTARMAVAQPIGSKAVEVLRFHDPAAGRTGPIALQMHNAGLFDEYKDISIEVNPTDQDLFTTR